MLTAAALTSSTRSVAVLVTVARAPFASVMPATLIGLPLAGLIVRFAAPVLATMSGASEPGFAVIVALPNTFSVVPFHVAELPGASQAGSAGGVLLRIRRTEPLPRSR